MQPNADNVFAEAKDEIKENCACKCTNEINYSAVVLSATFHGEE
jgi:hypothetical protein